MGIIFVGPQNRPRIDEKFDLVFGPLFGLFGLSLGVVLGTSGDTLWPPSWPPKSNPKSINFSSRKQIAQREPQDAPRAPLGCLETPQEIPGRPQEAPRRLPGRPQSRKSQRNECVLASFLDNASLKTTPTPGERPVTRRPKSDRRAPKSDPRAPKRDPRTPENNQTT